MTRKRKRFVSEYLVDHNGTQAAIRAGFSAKTANRIASQLLTKLDVKAAIDAGQAEQQRRTGITADRVVNELAKIAFSDLRDAFDASGQLLSPQQLGDAVAGALASIEVTRETVRHAGETTTSETVTKIRAWDKVRALELLGKYLGILKEHVEHTGKQGRPMAMRVLFGGRYRPDGQQHAA